LLQWAVGLNQRRRRWLFVIGVNLAGILGMQEGRIQQAWLLGGAPPLKKMNFSFEMACFGEL